MINPPAADLIWIRYLYDLLVVKIGNRQIVESHMPVFPDPQAGHLPIHFHSCSHPREEPQHQQEKQDDANS